MMSTEPEEQTGDPKTESREEEGRVGGTLDKGIVAVREFTSKVNAKARGRKIQDLAEKLQIEERHAVKMMDSARERYSKLEHDNPQFQDECDKSVRENLEKVKDERFLPRPEWRHRSYPDIVIAGFHKTGRSQLYSLLTSHPDGHIAFQAKERPLIQEMDASHVTPTKDTLRRQSQEDEKSMQNLHRQLYQFHSDLYQMRTLIESKVGSSDAQKKNDTRTVVTRSSLPLLIHTSQRILEFDYHASYLDFDLSPTTKFIYLFQDPADWIWSSYNFWFDEQSDTIVPNGWIDSKKHRSPENFHGLWHRDGNLLATSFLNSLRDESIHSPRRLRHALSKMKGGGTITDRVLFLRSEDMSPERIYNTGFLDRLTSFTGLERQTFNHTIASRFSNCDERMDGTHHRFENQQSGFSLPSHRTMLESTRRLIYTQFHAECRIWAHEFGIVYKACLEAVS